MSETQEPNGLNDPIQQQQQQQPEEVEDTSQRSEQQEEPPTTDKKKKKKKSVGFAPPPAEDLKQHHQELQKKIEIKKKSNPFQKVPVELAYLERKKLGEGPKPLLQLKQVGESQPKAKPVKLLNDLSTMKFFDVKDISVQNKETELQFHYTTIDLPPNPNSIIVDIKYGSLNSYDLSKINQYLLNVSNIKVGLGFEFSGVVAYVGSNMKDKYSINDYVFGILDPNDKRGALSTNQIVYPGRDVAIKVNQELLDQLDDIDIDLSFTNANEDFEIDSDSEPSIIPEPSKHRRRTEFPVEDKLPPLAKLSTISVLYNRSKQLLQHLQPTNRANLLINGADTNIGLTLIQTLFAEYNFEHINLILIIRESSQHFMEQAISNFKQKYFDPSTEKHISIIPFDLLNEDLIFPGERIPIQYKKPTLLATEIFQALFKPHDIDHHPQIDPSNVVDYKLDYFIDLIGCKKYFQPNIHLNELDSLSLPFKAHLASSLESLFGKTKEPFFVKLLKPKKYGSAMISGCKYTLETPSYNIDKLIELDNPILNPWANKFTSGLFNNWTPYNYFQEMGLEIREEWTKIALELVLAGRMKFRIGGYRDWRNGYKELIKDLRVNDGKIVFKIEDF